MVFAGGRKVQELLREIFFERGQGIGESVSLWKSGEEVLTLSRGYRDKETSSFWKEETLVPFFSATKGPSASILLKVLSENGINVESLVAKVWRNFPVPNATFADILSHSCGLAALDVRVSIFSHNKVIQAIEKQTPHWVLGEGHGYHPKTFGFLIDECTRRISGSSISEIWNQELAKGAGVDFWIGLPESEHYRVASVYAPKKVSSQEQDFLRVYKDKASLTRKAFDCLTGLESISAMNFPKAWLLGNASMGGIGSAKGLAHFYQLLLQDRALFPLEALKWASEPRAKGFDYVLLRETAFTCGFMCSSLSLNLFGERGFGHAGRGGVHAFGDLNSGISFAYARNQKEANILPDIRVKELVEAIDFSS